MSKWRVADSLQTLLAQLNEAFPKRSKASDGSIGDASHASRSSDHNPWVKDKKGEGVVTARDFTHDWQTGIDGQWLADTLVRNKDPRIKYVIWNGQICSSKSSPWKWRPYHGVNAHQHHVHVSVVDDPKLYDSTKPWKLDFPKPTTSDVAKVVEDSTAVPHMPDSQSPPIVQTTSPGAQADSDDTAKTQPSNTDSGVVEQTTLETSDGESAVSTKTTLLEDKEIEAPPSDRTGTAAAKTTVLGIVIPSFIVAAWSAAKQAIADGFISAADVGTAVLGFIRTNAKYIALVVAIFILYRIVRKVVRHVTFWIQMLTVANPKWHTVTVTPAPPNDGKWYEFWK